MYGLRKYLSIAVLFQCVVWRKVKTFCKRTKRVDLCIREEAGSNCSHDDQPDWLVLVFNMSCWVLTQVSVCSVKDLEMWLLSAVDRCESAPQQQTRCVSQLEANTAGSFIFRGEKTFSHLCSCAVISLHFYFTGPRQWEISNFCFLWTHLPLITFECGRVCHCHICMMMMMMTMADRGTCCALLFLWLSIFWRFIRKSDLMSASVLHPWPCGPISLVCGLLLLASAPLLTAGMNSYRNPSSIKSLVYLHSLQRMKLSSLRMKMTIYMGFKWKLLKNLTVTNDEQYYTTCNKQSCPSYLIKWIN